MKISWWLLFLSAFLNCGTGCRSSSWVLRSVSCDSRSYRDSLIVRYVDSGANKLPYAYNNPCWDKYFDSLLAICPNIAEAYQLKAIPAIKNGEYEKAYRLNAKAAQLDSLQFIPYLAFLKCIFTKDYRAAIEDFNEAIHLVPSGVEMDHTFYFYLGICYLQLKEFANAAKNFNQDIATQKKANPSGDVHFNSLLYLGILKMESTQDDTAVICFKECLRIYKELPEGNYYLGILYKKRNQLDSAMKYFDIAQHALLNGYSLNEDNQFYINYPYQITQYEIVEQQKLIGK